MTIRIHFDIETYSENDLTKSGVHRYAADPSTDVLLASGVVTKGGHHNRVIRWRPGQPCPYLPLGDPSTWEIYAWNAQFERIMWNEVLVSEYGWPKLELEQFICVAAQSRIMAAGPGKLDTAAQFFAQGAEKDHRGHLHMLKMCRPATDKQQLDWMEANRSTDREAAKRCHHTSTNLDRLHAYCDDDVRAEMAIHAILPEWTDATLDTFWENEYINDTGIVVDRKFARAAIAYADDEKAMFNEQLTRLSNGRVTTPKQYQRIKEWLLPMMSEEAVKLTEVYKNGEKKNTFDGNARGNLLNMEPGALPDTVREVIEIIDSAGKSTIAKFQAMTDCAVAGYTDDEPRVHGLFMFGGAAQTGRFSSVKLQLQNLLRHVPNMKDDGYDAVDAIEAFKADDEDSIRNYGRPIHTLSKLVRPSLMAAPGKSLIWGDWAGVEARALPWLTAAASADKTLAIFRRGDDIYLKVASDILKRNITKADKEERQAYGKVPTLACGFGGGVGAFQAMARNLGVNIKDKQAQEIVTKWRAANPWAPEFWKRLETAALYAMRRPGVSFSAGRVQYRYDPKALGGQGALFCALPSGRELCYPRARIEVSRTPWGEDKLGVVAAKAAWRPAADDISGDWPTINLYGGFLAENCIAKDTDVLTRRGWVPIQDVTTCDAVWDGVEWVAHAGSISKGRQTCMSICGLFTTPDHRILTDDQGWQTAAAMEREGFERSDVRLPDSFAPHHSAGRKRWQAEMAILMRLWRGGSESRGGSFARKDAIVRLHDGRTDGGDERNTWHVETSGIRSMAFHAGSMQTSVAPSMAQLRWSGDICLYAVGVIRKFLGRYGAYILDRFIDRSHQQQRELRTLKLPMGEYDYSSQQQTGESNRTNSEWGNDGSRSKSKIWGECDHYSIPPSERMDGYRGLHSGARFQQFEVYDLMNCGPRNRFVVRGSDGPVIVHNCTQATCADLLMRVLRKANAKGLTVVSHVHDEVVTESDDVSRDLPILRKLLLSKPKWPGIELFPLDADIEYGTRYKVAEGSF